MADTSPEEMRPPRAPRVGLVLGGGGVLGAAWLIGALHVLAEESGWDPRSADYVVGTSAGAVVGALVAAGLPPWFLVHHQRGGSVAGMSTSDGQPIASADEQTSRLFRPGGRLPWPVLGSPALALRSALRPWRFPPAAAAVGWMWRGFLSTQHIGSIVRTMVPEGWTEHPNTWVCAVDYATGRRVVFGRDGAPATDLYRAVEASCAIPGFYEPVRIDGRLYVDGGAWSPSNLDVAARTDADLVVALNPMTSLNPGIPTTLLDHVQRQIRRLSGRRLGLEARRVRETGKQLLLVQPEAEDLAAMGVNLMNPRRRRLVLVTALATTRRQLADAEARAMLKLLAG